jgi:hypothetical protein
MRKVCLIVVFGLAGVAFGLLRGPDRWVIVRDAGSHKCTLQETTRPITDEVLGRRHSKEEAQKAINTFRQSGACE